MINGQEEARMIYNNHIECLEDRAGNYIYVDVGGGSTEINFLINGELVQSLSYNIGTVRMLSNSVREGSWEQMKSDLTRLTADFQGVNIMVRVEILINFIVLLIKRIRNNHVCQSLLCRSCMIS